MFEALDMIEREELELRWSKCRSLLPQLAPGAQGLLVLSPVNIYWSSGHLANGLLWLPLEGEPLLLVRKGLERARLESAIEQIHPFLSFKDLPRIMSEAGYAVPHTAAVEFSGLSWDMGRKMESRLEGWKFVEGDSVLSRARAVKTQRELEVMRLAGQRHAYCLDEDIPRRIEPGMNEREIGAAIWDSFFEQGNHGLTRLGSPGEDFLLGHICAGDSGNYPSAINGPVGVRGEHPSAPVLGYPGKIWKRGQILTMDTVFFLEGYHTDKTRVFFAGSPREIDPELHSAQAFCHELQQSVSEMLRPGVTPAQIHEHCSSKAQKQGYSEGFMGLEENKVPFVGHGIGLILDEYPVLAAKFTEPLQEDMVIALEPKVGLAQWGMVGVENTFRVTAEGGECLTGFNGDFHYME